MNSESDTELEEWLKTLNITCSEPGVLDQVGAGQWEEALQTVLARLPSRPYDAGLHLVLAYIYEKKQMLQHAGEGYDDASRFMSREQTELLQQTKGALIRESGKRSKIVFFVKPGMDAFLDPIIEHLSRKHRTMKLIIRNVGDIEPGMRWADVCWFEWCDDLIVHGSRLPVASYRKIVCRLHSYEALSNYIYRVCWRVVNKLIFVGEHIQEYVLSQVSALRQEQTAVIPNGVLMDRYPLAERTKGFNIAYVGYINHKKGPMLLLHAFKAIYDRDPRYKLFIAGTYQDQRYRLYFEQMIVEMNLSESVQFDGWQKDVNAYLKDKHFILSTSPLESQHMSIMEAMAAGVKPLIHHFYGAKKVYPHAWIWNTIGELVDRVAEEDYHSASYRAFVADNYAFSTCMLKIDKLIEGIGDGAKSDREAARPPLITVGIINYNYGHYLDECLQSVIRQSYRNIEIIIVDDRSTDDSLSKIEAYRSLDPRIKVIQHPENAGMADVAFRDIFHKAAGEYALLLSADDYLPHDDVLAEYWACFEEDRGTDYVYGNLTLVDGAGRINGSWTYKTYSVQEAVRSVYERRGSGVIPMVGLFKLSFYRQNASTWVIDPGNPLAGDTLNCLINLRRGWRTRYLNQSTLCYRRHRTNMTYDIGKRIRSVVSVMEYIVNEFNEEMYLPSLQWDLLEEGRRKSLKWFTLGQTYASMARSYSQTAYVSRLDPDGKRQCMQPIIDKVMQYYEACLALEPTYGAAVQKSIAETVGLTE